ncbi:MAG: class I SAM-dependent methyltransferase [Patescibacteria group bacterium]
MKPWEIFFKERTKQIFNEKKIILDIGGGLRVIKEKGNRYDAQREWIRSYIEKTDYKVLDVIDTYHPDIVGDIHALPLSNESIEGLFAIAILQHVEDPKQAFKEIHRVLAPGGYAFIYVPFLYYYHGEKGYYKDYWRYTEDSLRLLAKDFSGVEIVNVRGAIETWIKISPLGRIGFLNDLAYLLDRLTGKLNSKQTSGYNVFLTK